LSAEPSEDDGGDEWREFDEVVVRVGEVDEEIVRDGTFNIGDGGADISVGRDDTAVVVIDIFV